MTTRDQVLQNLSTLKDSAKVYHQTKVLRACGLGVEGSEDSYHEHKVSELRQLLERATTSSVVTATDFAEPDSFDQDVDADAE